MNPVCGYEVPVILRYKGDHVVVKAKKGDSVMRGVLTRDILSDKSTFGIRLDGTDHMISFYRDDWFITLVPPEIPEGLYVGLGNVYRVLGNEIRGTGASLSSEGEDSMLTRTAFSNHIKSGKIRRVAEVTGVWL